MINLLWSAVIMVSLLSGCGWSGTPTRNNDFIPLTSMEIVAISPTIAAHTSTKLSVKGNFSGMFTRDITDQVVWSSDVPTVAAFSTATSPNRVTGLIPGTAALTATVGSVSATFNMTVSSATITSLVITPATPTIYKGLNAQFVANGTFSDATTQDISFDATWSTGTPAVATVSNDPGSKGFAQALTIGTAAITASFDGISGSTLLTVTEPVLQSIALSLTNPSILTLSTVSFKATGSYSDGSSSDITSLVTWSSSNTGFATIAASGTATALTQGLTAISATLGGISGTTNLKVTGGNLTAITVSPATVTLVKDVPVRIYATGSFSNGSTRDITDRVTWTSDTSSLATVTSAGGALAWLNPLAVTSSTKVTATYGTLSATSSLSVTAPLLSSIALSATTLDLTSGTSAPLSVAATFDNGTVQDVTTLSIWTSNDTTKATVAAGGLGTERVTGVASGTTTTTISATYGGKTVLTPATVTIRQRILQSLAISGSSSVAVGNQVSFTALASYSDGTSADVTADTVWSINTANVAILADSVNRPGQITGVDSGSATLTAGFGGKSQTVTITVP